MSMFISCGLVPFPFPSTGIKWTKLILAEKSMFRRD